MRIHLTREVIIMLRRLGDNGAELRRRIEALKRTPRPPDACAFADRPGRYEFFVETGAYSGVWVICQQSQDRGETVVTIAAIEENE